MKRVSDSLLAVVLLASLCGCATAPSPIDQYAGANRPRAEAGELKWSEYYKGLYATAATSEANARGSFMTSANAMIAAALAYEGQSISKAEFEHLRRQAQIAQVVEADARTRAARVQMIKMMTDDAARRNQEADRAYEQAYRNIVQPRATTTSTTSCDTGLGDQLNCTTTTR